MQKDKYLLVKHKFNGDFEVVGAFPDKEPMLKSMTSRGKYHIFDLPHSPVIKRDIVVKKGNTKQLKDKYIEVCEHLNISPHFLISRRKGVLNVTAKQLIRNWGYNYLNLTLTEIIGVEESLSGKKFDTSTILNGINAGQTILSSPKWNEKDIIKLIYE